MCLFTGQVGPPLYLYLYSRAHMIRLPANYKNKNDDARCTLCGKEEGTTEHAFRCEKTQNLKRTWNTTEEHLKSMDPYELQRASKFLQNVETLVGLEFGRGE